jgi:bacterial/archaeal transporter family protein
MPTWVIYAIISMLFAGVTSVLAKYGLKEVSGDVALIVRTSFIFLIVWVNTFLFDDVKTLGLISRRSLIFLLLSGLTTSVSWIYYYRAIKIGQVSQVALIDKGSIIITLLLSFTILHETPSLKTLIGAGFVLVGLLVMIWR